MRNAVSRRRRLLQCMWKLPAAGNPPTGTRVTCTVLLGAVATGSMERLTGCVQDDSTREHVNHGSKRAFENPCVDRLDQVGIDVRIDCRDVARCPPHR